MLQHILPKQVLLNTVNQSWKTLWTTRIGRQPLHAFQKLDAQVIGKFFQEIMMYSLYEHDPYTWADPEKARNPKLPDFVCVKDPKHSFELKMCGQSGSRVVYGNRCSSQGFKSPVGKSRDGWMLTINYTGTRINLVRFGYIHGTDWIGQASSSGNSARLHPDTYKNKLEVIQGAYMYEADPRVLRGIGNMTTFTTIREAQQHGIQEADRFLSSDYYY